MTNQLALPHRFKPRRNPAPGILCGLALLFVSSAAQGADTLATIADQLVDVGCEALPGKPDVPTFQPQKKARPDFSSGRAHSLIRLRQQARRTAIKDAALSYSRNQTLDHLPS